MNVVDIIYSVCYNPVHPGYKKEINMTKRTEQNRTDKIYLLSEFDESFRNKEARKFYEEFLNHPERFQATDQALLNIYHKRFETSE